MTAYQRLPSAGYRSALDPALDDRTGRADARPLAALDLAWIDGKGRATWDNRKLPDTPEVAAAVSCLARGAMLRGPNGPVSIEDLMPGDRVATAAGGTAEIRWIGSRSYGWGVERPLLWRISARAFGGQGPESDIVLGADAQVLIDSPRCVPLVGRREAFAPVAAFEDGVTITAITPPGEVTVYGLACATQEAVLVSGLPVETYHPSRTTARSLNRVVLSDMARLFPQSAETGGFGAPRIPYLTLSEAQSLAM
ncbi:Hint domain-containing protein [Jannaschia formosa]|uniref:Hint domain-containing protein n=1 Tax=Jannaschia formosa TaxID=2259592 RepID=UPI0014310858|nr:Hint domain-containing protein [Jannaschia formosa]